MAEVSRSRRTTENESKIEVVQIDGLVSINFFKDVSFQKLVKFMITIPSLSEQPLNYREQLCI
jgi:hypothetical protein